MSRKSFRQLLQKYLRGDCTPEEKAFVEHWYGLLETETGESGKELDWQELENKLWNQMQRKMNAEEPTPEGRVLPLQTSLYRWMGIAVAASLVVGWFFMQQSTVETLSLPTIGNRLNGWLERTNTTTKPEPIRLEDGSTVQLGAQSTLRFPTKFASDKRIVYLTGDAFFDIQKMPSRPFYVHTGDVVTKVLGTSFFIRTQAETKQVRVEVVTGRVAVYEQPKQKQPVATNGVVLSPNQTATFFGKEQHFVTGLVDKPRMIPVSVTEKSRIAFVFDDAPLSDVLAQLKQAYGIDFEVENEAQNKCPLTADLSNQPLYTQLDIICAALKATYQVQGTTILISGKGCE